MAESFSSLQVALGDRYTIERELGRGGMATVYLAHDQKHDRPVAVKVLLPELAASLGAERFLREIHTAARLQHPHILALYDSGEAGGFLYYVMPFVDGESLRSRLDRTRQLPLDEALQITSEVASALAWAHTHGVVHRDIKPENILFSGGGDTAGDAGHALVADFGIARALSAAPGGTLTQVGMAVGTPSYMSPEQASADPTIDGRTDTYALGCVLYEMLAGHPPFLGSSTQQILARHARDPVPPLRTIRPELPEFVERAVGKALAKAPADRFATTTGLTAALAPVADARPKRRSLQRWMALGAGGVAVAAAGYLLIRPPTASAWSIAVLPFTNVGGDSTNEPYSDGVADELTTALGKVIGLAVTARGSVFSFKEKNLNAREIGRRLEVRYIVEGSVKSAGGRRRIGAQLVDVASGKELWSDNFEHDVRNRDVFTVNDSIARSIVRQLLPRLSPAALATPAKRPTDNAEAHELYLQGRFFFDKRSEAALKKAEVYFERAIALDSSYALAWSGLSDAYSHSSVFGYAKPADSFPKAKTYAIRALALDGTLAEAHASRAFVALFYEWDWETAGREFDLALAANPRSPSAHLWHAWYYLPLGKADRMIGEVQTAVDLDRFSAVANTRLVTALFFGHRYDAALAQALKTIDLNPEFVGVRLELARVYTYLGRCAEALPLLGEAQPSAQLSGVVGWVYARCGRRQQAVVELDRLVADAARGRYESHYGRAVIQAGLGNTDQVIAELEQAYVERAWAMFDLRIEPAFDNVRAEPRFVDLVRRMRFPS